MARQRPEQILQRQVAALLDTVLVPEAVWWHTPNGMTTTPRQGRIFKELGMKAGIPDIVILARGKAHFIELKAPPAVLRSGRLSRAKPRTSEDQDRMAVRLTLAGGVCFVAQTLEEVARILAMLGLSIVEIRG